MLAIGLNEQCSCLFSTSVETHALAEVKEALRLHAGGFVPDQILVVDHDVVVQHYDYDTMHGE